MSSPGAASFRTLSSNASSAPDRQETCAVNLPVPVTATAPKATTKTAYLTPHSATQGPNQATSTPNHAQPRSSANATNIPIHNGNNSNNSSHLRPRTVDLELLSHLEMGDANSVDLSQEQQSHRDRISDHPIQEFFSASVHTADKPEEEQEPELGWKDAYEVMIQAPLRSLAALARRMRMVRAQRDEGMV